MNRSDVEKELEAVDVQLNNAINELVIKSPVAQNILGQKAALEKLLNGTVAHENGAPEKLLTEDAIFEETH